MRLTSDPRSHFEPCPDGHPVHRRRRGPRTGTLLRGALLLLLSAGACKKDATTAAPTEPDPAVPAAPVALDGLVPATLVATEEVVPGRLTVKVYAHALPIGGEPLKMWTFVSDGFARHRQLEVATTVVRRAGEADDAYPVDVLALYRTIYKFAENGQLVPAGGISELSPAGPGLLDRPDFLIVYYAPGQLVPGVPLTGNFLTALFVTRDEHEQMRKFGQVRFLSALGKTSGYYPFPPWIDRDRPVAAPIAGGVLDEPIQRGTIPGLTITFEAAAAPTTGADPLKRKVAHDGGRFVLRLPPDAHKSLEQALKAYAAGVPVALFGELDAGSNGVFAHDPGNGTPLALGCTRVTAVRVAANFVILNPEGNNTGSVVDDGIAVLFDAATWKQLQVDLAAHQPITLPLADGHTLAVEWPAARNEAPAASYCLR